MAEIELHDGKNPVMLRYNEGNWELCWLKNVKDKDTKEVSQAWSAEKWYANPFQALSALLNMKVGNSNAKSIRELQDALESATQELLDKYNTQIKGV